MKMVSPPLCIQALWGRNVTNDPETPKFLIYKPWCNHHVQIDASFTVEHAQPKGGLDCDQRND